MDVPQFTPGLAARVELTVTEADTAQSVGSGDVPVLATPRVLALAELTRLEVPTKNGRKAWHPATVADILKRVDRIAAALALRLVEVGRAKGRVRGRASDDAPARPSGP